VTSVINAAFAMETFLEGSRTDEEHVSKMLAKGKCLKQRASGEPWWELPKIIAGNKVAQ